MTAVVYKWAETSHTHARYERVEEKRKQRKNLITYLEKSNRGKIEKTKPVLFETVKLLPNGTSTCFPFSFRTFLGHMFSFLNVHALPQRESQWEFW